MELAEKHMKEIKVKSVRDLGPQFINNSNKMVGQDGSYSIPLKNKSLFFFGDTLIGKRTENESLWYPGGSPVGPDDMSGMGGIEKMITNTGLLCYNISGEFGFSNFDYILDDDKQLKQLIKLDEEDDPKRDRIWCLHGININDKVYLYFIKIKMLDEGEPPANFEIIGSGLVAGDEKTWEFERIKRNGSSILWKYGGPCFASAVLYEEGFSYVYLFGSNRGEDGSQKAHLARVKPHQIEDIESYEYFISPEEGWTGDVNKSLPVFTGMPNELSVSYNRHLGCYLAVHSLELTGKIVGRTSPYPWGPWSEPVTLWQIVPQKNITGPHLELLYAGKEHCSFSKENGKTIYITYIEFEEYYPHLIEVTFE